MSAVTDRELAPLLAAAHGVEHIAANAAVAELGAAAASPDVEPATRTRIWRQLCAVARCHRPDRLPEVSAAAVVARDGPPECLATVVQTAFRLGPEDADDRMTALASLGRFGHVQVADWLGRVLASGAASHEALVALAQWIRGADARWRQINGPRLRASLETTLAPAGEGPVDACDIWQRWAGLEALAALLGPPALAHVVGAWQAVGDDDAPWYPRYLAALAAGLANESAIARSDLALAQACLRRTGQPAFELPPLPKPEALLLARSPRIARHAAAQVQLVALPSAAAKARLLRRAAIETMMVRRGQLIASLLPGPAAAGADEPELAAQLAAYPPWCHLLSDAERADLAARERDWIDG